ncbi:MAG: hypothetical protein ACI4F4_10265 [Lachnospiraceae bacterium]
MNLQVISEKKINDYELEKVLILKSLFEKNASASELEEYMGKDYFYFKNLYHGRNMLLEILDLNQSMSVLQIGSSCGVFTEKLAGKVDWLTQIELSKDRSDVNYLRNEHVENVDLLVGDYAEVNKHLDLSYDRILMLSTIEETRAYHEDFITLENLIAMYKAFMKQESILYIAVNNKLGMKYLSGSKDKFDLGYFQSFHLEDTFRFTKKEITNMAEKTGMKIKDFYYPYPDAFFPTKFFSDDYLPQIGELMEPVADYENPRLRLFDTGFMYNLLVQEGLFDRFCTSYLVGLELGENS